MTRKIFVMVLNLSFLAANLVLAQDRDTKVRNDRKEFETSRDWIYNSLNEGIRVATAANKPMLVIFRCIPCEACQKFDDDVARRDPVIRDLMDQFVCVRLVQANTMDLAHFQFDFDLSFAAFLLNPDLTIYGRFGTRSEREESRDISLEGLRQAMAEALRLHKNYAAVKPSLTGKQIQAFRYKTPLDDPSLASKFPPKLDYEGQVARSCMHCHQIRDAERERYHTAGEPIPDDVLFPYPDPGAVGLTMDPRQMATIQTVATGSLAGQAGFQPGDQVITLAGQPLLSIADLQWVLHHAPATGSLPAEVQRDGKTQNLTLMLREGWRRGDISWRVTTWALRRMGLGGMRLDDLTPEQRAQEKLPGDVMALRVRHVGEFGDHAVARRAGFQKGDILLSFDGQNRSLSESALLAHAVQQKRPGDEVAVTVLRGGERKTMTLVLP